MFRNLIAFIMYNTGWSLANLSSCSLWEYSCRLKSAGSRKLLFWERNEGVTGKRTQENTLGSVVPDSRAKD